MTATPEQERQAHELELRRRISADADRMLRAAYGEAFHEVLKRDTQTLKWVASAFPRDESVRARARRWWWRRREQVAELFERLADRVRGF